MEHMEPDGRLWKPTRNIIELSGKWWNILESNRTSQNTPEWSGTIPWNIMELYGMWWKVIEHSRTFPGKLWNLCLLFYWKRKWNVGELPPAEDLIGPAGTWIRCPCETSETSIRKAPNEDRPLSTQQEMIQNTQKQTEHSIREESRLRRPSETSIREVHQKPRMVNQTSLPAATGLSIRSFQFDAVMWSLVIWQLENDLLSDPVTWPNLYIERREGEEEVSQLHF